MLSDLARPATRTPLLPGADVPAFLDIDSMQRRTYGEDAWTPITYPRAVFDEQAGGWVSDAEVAEILGEVRGQRRLAHLGGDQPQPAARARLP